MRGGIGGAIAAVMLSCAGVASAAPQLAAAASLAPAHAAAARSTATPYSTVNVAPGSVTPASR